MTPREIQEMARRIASYLKGVGAEGLLATARGDTAAALAAGAEGYEVNQAGFAAAPVLGTDAAGGTGGGGALVATGSDDAGADADHDHSHAVGAAASAGAAAATSPSTGSAGGDAGAGGDEGKADDSTVGASAPASASGLTEQLLPDLEAPAFPVVPGVRFAAGATAEQMLATLLAHPELIVANYADKNVLDQAMTRAFAHFVIRACALDLARNRVIAEDGDTAEVDAAAEEFQAEFNGLYRQALSGCSAFGYAVKEVGSTLALGAVATLGALVAAGYTVTAVEDEAAEVADERTLEGRIGAGIGAGFFGVLFAAKVRDNVTELNAWRTSDPHAALHSAVASEVTTDAVDAAPPVLRMGG